MLTQKVESLELSAVDKHRQIVDKAAEPSLKAVENDQGHMEADAGPWLFNTIASPREGRGRSEKDAGGAQKDGIRVMRRLILEMQSKQYLQR